MWFFPPRGQAQLANKARVVCLNCTVRPECKAYREETNSEAGVWAGELYTRKDVKEEDDT